MAEAIKLQGRIEKAKRNIEKSYSKTLKDVAKLKKKINELELSISQKEHAKTSGNLDALNFAMESLNKLTDSQILRSEKAWKKLKNLEHNCKRFTFEPAGLDDLRVLCKKTEEFAADLLCYSLAHFKRESALGTT